MIYLDIFIGFLKIGLFAFGGAYGAIPLIRDLVLKNNWLSDEAISYMIAVSESTPGPLMVNLATFVGNSKAGLLGAILATLAVILPSFIIIILVAINLRKVINNKYFKAILQGLKPAIIGIILATGIYMIHKNCLLNTFNITNILLTIFLLLITYLPKKKPSPITLIIISAIIGIIIF